RRSATSATRNPLVDSSEATCCPSPARSDPLKRWIVTCSSVTIAASTQYDDVAEGVEALDEAWLAVVPWDEGAGWAVHARSAATRAAVATVMAAVLTNVRVAAQRKSAASPGGRWRQTCDHRRDHDKIKRPNHVDQVGPTQEPTRYETGIAH